MLEVVFAKAAGLKKLFKALGEVADHVFVIADATGLEFKAKDSVVISLVTISAEMTEEYHCSETLSFGLSLAKLNVLMRLSARDDKVTLRTTKDAEAIEVLMEPQTNARDISFKLNLVQMEANYDREFPTDDFQCKVTTSTAWLLRALSSITDLSEAVTIAVDKKSIRLKFKSQDMGGFINLEPADRKTAIVCRYDIQQSASSYLLNRVFKAARVSELVHIGMEYAAPFFFQFAFEYGLLSYYVAPMLV